MILRAAAQAAPAGVIAMLLAVAGCASHAVTSSRDAGVNRVFATVRGMT